MAKPFARLARRKLKVKMILSARASENYRVGQKYLDKT